jgi:ABC-2 type transport system ATP-binding protein
VLTTHYLEEADALSDRIIVMDKGRILAEGTPATIKAQTAGRRVRAVTDMGDAELRSLPGVVSMERVGAAVDLLSTAAEATVSALLASGREISDLQVTDVGLEQAFLALTRNGGMAPGATGTATQTGASA